jgi:sporulation protein YqfC
VSVLKNWKERLSDPQNEKIKPRTLAEVYGREQLLVEHHRGILGYGTDCIRIAATYGVLAVEGEDLRLCCMSRQQVVIRGRIDAVRTEEGS